MKPREQAIIDAIRAGRARANGSTEEFLRQFGTSLHASGYAVVPLGDLDGFPPTTGNDYSKRAAYDIAPRAGSLRYRVLEQFAIRPMTTYEMERVLGGKHQTISARVYELHKGHYIEPTGEERTTDSGSAAGIYRITPAGLGVVMDREGDTLWHS